MRALLLGAASLAMAACAMGTPQTAASPEACDVTTLIKSDRARILDLANDYLSAEPSTVTADIAIRSAGGPNDFYSEGDYWWPVPGDPDAAYQRRDGQSNPDNFVAHRLSMMRLSDILGSLGSAYRITGDPAYAEAANAHLRAWFVAPETRMTPTLNYAQAIQGRHTGRSIGLIDTLHLVEVARAAKILGEAGALPPDDLAAIQAWFADYTDWMTTHPYGTKERDHHNNHAVAWALQVAAFADLTGDKTRLAMVRERFRTIFLPEQMRADGGFTDELSRTKPYGYSLFILDLMAGVAQLASVPGDDLWTFERDDGRSLKRGIDFMRPYVDDKSAWPYPQDIAYWEEWPVRHTAFLFAAQAYDNCGYMSAVRIAPPIARFMRCAATLCRAILYSGWIQINPQDIVNDPV